MAEPVHSIAATITGDDSPGIGILARAPYPTAGRDRRDIEILDWSRQWCADSFSIGLLGHAAGGFAALEDRLAGTCGGWGSRSRCREEGIGDNPPRQDRAMTRPRPAAADPARRPGHDVITELGGNIDRSRRLSRTPLTSLELWVSRVDAKTSCTSGPGPGRRRGRGRRVGLPSGHRTAAAGASW